MNARILVFAGSARQASLNKKLARLGAEAVREAGGESTFIDLRDFPMPLYDGDVERAEGIPAAAMRLKQLFKAHQGLLIASPENNASVSALLKNTIDWLSRATPQESGTVPFKGKVAALLAASPGALGGLRGLPHLRQIFTTLGVIVLPEQLGVPRANDAFDADGALKDPAQREALAALARRLVDVAGRLSP